MFFLYPLPLHEIFYGHEPYSTTAPAGRARGYTVTVDHGVKLSFVLRTSPASPVPLDWSSKCISMEALAHRAARQRALPRRPKRFRRLLRMGS